MLVSLAVISVAMAVVGVVFSITTKTASQSAAYSEAHNWVRQFTQQIEEDLRHCDPANSIMVIVGRTQAAALTAVDVEAGKHYRVLVGDPGLVPAGYDPEYADTLDVNNQYSDPRADILMFFSKRPTASVAPNPSAATPDPFAGGVKFSPIRVVYGHAAFGDPLWNSSARRYDPPPLGTLRHIEETVSTISGDLISRIPASRWHLGRVATIIVDPVSLGLFANTQFSLAACENVARGWPYEPGQMAGDAALLSMPTLLDMFGPNGAAYFGAGTILAWRVPYSVYRDLPTLLRPTLNSLIYATGNVDPPPNHHVATVLNDVPAELAGNMGVHMLPGCAWFQVEFLMPEDPRNSAQYSRLATGGASPLSSHSDVPRWASAWGTGMPVTYVFVPDTAENRELVANQVKKTPVVHTDRLWTFARLDQNVLGNHYQTSDALSQRIIRMWPYAIRITVRVYDPNGRLDEPIVRTIVHRFE